ncbi:MAG: ATPase, partial [Candidatus Methanomethylophilaceae archaeon]
DEKWLGRHLDAECKKELIELREKFGISIIGEGGEYESMTLDSPAYEKKLELIDSNVESEKSSATLTVTKAVLKDKI